MTNRRIVDRKLLFDAISTTQTTAAINVSDYKNAVISLGGATQFSGTIFVRGGLGTGTELQDAPTFSSTASAVNMWDNIDTVDLEDGTSIDGDTGIVYASSNDVRLIELNVNSLDWVAIYANVHSGTITGVLANTTNE